MDDDWFSDDLTHSPSNDSNDLESPINRGSRRSSTSSSSSSLSEPSVDDNDVDSFPDFEQGLQNIVEIHHQLLMARANLMNADVNEDIDDNNSEEDDNNSDLARFVMEGDIDSDWDSDDDANEVYVDEDDFHLLDSGEDEGNDDFSGDDSEVSLEIDPGVEDEESDHRSVSSTRSTQDDSDTEINNAYPNAIIPALLPRARQYIPQQQQEQQPQQLQQQQDNEHDDDNVVQIQKKARLELPEEKKEDLCLDDTSDEDQKCPICLESWTNAGEHRLCSLRCGHLFGLSCINQWINRPQSAKNCPECKAKASRRDIRVLYAKRLVAIDTVETQKLQVQLNDALQKQKSFQQELDRYRSKEVAYKTELSNWQQKCYDLEKQLQLISAEKAALNVSCGNLCLTRNKIFDINGTCRVMAFNPWNNVLAISSDNAINRIFMELDLTPPPVNVHSNSIRDIAFQEQHPNFLLSVGFDKKVILTDIRTGCLTHSYKEETNLWSCCWSNYNQQSFFVGGAKGTVIEYDIRFLQSNVSTKENPNDQSPVVSLASVPTTSPTLHAGGYLVCQLNSCSAYSFKEGNYIGNQIDIEGPFLFLRYNEKDNHVLLSCRANPKNPSIRHMVCTIDKKDDKIHFNKVHTFNGGNMQKFLSRPCYMNLPNDTLVIANDDSRKSLVGWSVSSGKESFSLPISEDALDMCAFECSGIYQAVLTKSKLHLFKHQPA